jgi:hypothetical protein
MDFPCLYILGLNDQKIHFIKEKKMKKIIFLVIAALFVSGAAWGQFDWMYAVNTESTESQTSQGIFTSRIDDYIDWFNFDPNVGRFLFVGGSNDFYTSNSATIGYGATLNSGYLGLYLNGNLFNKTQAGDPNWNTNFALLWSINENISLRFDMQLEGENPDPVVGFTLGGFKFMNNKAYVSAGYDAEVKVFGAQAGILFESGSELDVGFSFADSYSWGGVRGVLCYELEIEKFTFGFSPSAILDFSSINSNSSFGLATFITAGFNYQLTKRFKLYSGSTLRIFEIESPPGSGWVYQGIRWTNNLAIGLTFTPVEDFVIGANISAWNLSQGAGGFNANMNFTVSYKFDSKPKDK